MSLPEFKTDVPIYRQLVDYCYNCILDGQWQPGERIMSVREMALAMSVNTRTALRAFECLESDGIITRRRGMGFYLSEGARESVVGALRREFFEEKVPELVERMRALGITPSELLTAIGEG